MKSLIIALVLALLPSLACADEPLVYLESIPYVSHITTSTDTYTFNDHPNGLAALVPLTSSGDLEAVALNFKNSFYRTTNVIGLSYTPLRIGPFRLGGLAGISNPSAYPDSAVKPFIGAFEANVILGLRTQLNVDVLPCGSGALWCKAAVAFGVKQGLGRR